MASLEGRRGREGNVLGLEFCRPEEGFRRSEKVVAGRRGIGSSSTEEKGEGLPSFGEKGRMGGEEGRRRLEDEERREGINKLLRTLRGVTLVTLQFSELFVSPYLD